MEKLLWITLLDLIQKQLLNVFYQHNVEMHLLEM
jgi:hypothetical protein